MIEPPKHKYEVTIKLGAHSVEAVISTLQGMIFSIDQDGLCNRISGGWDGSYDMEVEERPDVTPEQYREELRLYIEATHDN